MDSLHRVVSLGYNGFPRGVVDDYRLHNHDLKYKIMVHCERNALLFAPRLTEGCTLYTWPFMSCTPCAAMVIQAGIRRCVAPVPSPDKGERWGADFVVAKQLFEEAGVVLEEVEDA